MVIILGLLFAQVWMIVFPVFAATPITFTGSELLGRPTATSVTVNIIPNSTIEYYYDYGTVSGAYSGQTAQATAVGGEPHETVISGLTSNTKYYYRMAYQPEGQSGWIERDEYSFWTQRSEGEEFTFTITSDSHVNIMLGNSTTWTQTMNNVADDGPDFLIDLGDTFAMDDVSTVSGAENAYKYQRQFFDLVGNSASIFLALGNHEETEGWHLDDTGNPATSQPVLATNAMKKFYLNPITDGFYSGNPDTFSFISEDHLLEDYYAWTWGDALFVVIDPFWYTTTKPFLGNTGGGETSDTGSGDRWDWTLGYNQYAWLQQTLEDSTAKYKFIFSHHMVGGSDDYVRGGANPAHLVEWGGYNESTGSVWEFDAERSGWGSIPIHQLFVANNVSAFFHGHDHQYAYEMRDGIVYQSLPAAGFSGSGFGIYTTGSGYTIKALPSPGHLRVNVTSTQTTVAYVATAGAAINYSYTVDPAIVGPTYELTLAANPPAGGTTIPAVGVHSYVEDENVGITAIPNPDYQFVNWSGDCEGTGACNVIMDEDRSVTANFELIPITQYMITASAGLHGSILPIGAVLVTEGDDQSFTITPDSGYQVSDVLVDGLSVGVVSTYEFSAVSMDHTISASFELIPLVEYMITATAGLNGSISPSGAVLVSEGDNQNFTITPGNGYQVAEVLVDGLSVGDVSSYTFLNVTEDHTIAASFEAIQYTITASAGANGSISPSGVVLVNEGDNQNFTITPSSGYRVADVLLDSVSVGPVTSYWFTAVTGDHTIVAIFELIPSVQYTITASAGPNGSISPSGAVLVVEGQNQTFTILPDEDYEVLDVLINGLSMGPLTTYEFVNVQVDHTIEVIFDEAKADFNYFLPIFLD